MGKMNVFADDSIVFRDAALCQLGAKAAADDRVRSEPQAVQKTSRLTDCLLHLYDCFKVTRNQWRDNGVTKIRVSRHWTNKGFRFLLSYEFNWNWIKK